MTDNYSELIKLSKVAAAKHDWKQAEACVLAAMDVVGVAEALPELERLRECYRGQIQIESGNWLSLLFKRAWRT
jgi:hypothetical protein